MVFFTCNNCGDSLKKKDCANHVGKCRPLALTCVDCHKDFFGDEFVAHTSCVTEAEKYGVKGFVSRAPSTAGVAKQEEWTRAVLSASEASGLTSSQKYFLGILTRHGNVPRKKKPFQNFARNVWRDSVRNINVVDQVFDMLEAELKKIKGPPKESDTPKARADNIGEIDDEAINSVAELKVDITSNKKPKGKKEKALDELIAIANGGKEKIEIFDVIKDQDKKSKKKNRAASCDSVEESKENENETEVAPANSENDMVSKKSKKKKHKKQDTEIEEDVTQNGNGTIEESVTAEDDPPIMKNKKKIRRQKEAQVEEATKNGNGLENESFNAEDDSSSTGKKNKKNKLAETNENGSVELLVDLLKKAKKKKHKKQEEDSTEALESQNILEAPQCDEAEDTIKKSKKKKHKLQEAEDDVPRKKSKSKSR